MNNLPMPSNRIMNFGIFFVTVLTIAIALYMEHVMLLSPCGLCITQRVFFILCGLVCLVRTLIRWPTDTNISLFLWGEEGNGTILAIATRGQSSA